MAALDAEAGDDAIDGAADGDATGTEVAIVFGGFEEDGGGGHGNPGESFKVARDAVGFCGVSDSSENLHGDKVANDEAGGLDVRIQQIRRR